MARHLSCVAKDCIFCRPVPGKSLILFNIIKWLGEDIGLRSWTIWVFLIFIFAKLTDFFEGFSNAQVLLGKIDRFGLLCVLTYNTFYILFFLLEVWQRFSAGFRYNSWGIFCNRLHSIYSKVYCYSPLQTSSHLPAMVLQYVLGVIICFWFCFIKKKRIEIDQNWQQLRLAEYFELNSALLFPVSVP